MDATIRPPMPVSGYPVQRPGTPADARPTKANEDAGDDGQLKEVFSRFVGETFFGQLIQSMRTSTGKPAYFHGGRAEEVFQGQLDQVLAEKMSEVSSQQIAEPMFELFNLQRR